ncbi:prolyl oligopeptidase family serine peptidase [Amnibacterium flavum]|uniref:S9 family peptidase n=1 Tax=Amnibacterium flavum TaxID=2173173 RepID=A0A2V1HRB9_9MICO|nr:prolyl oligopeptidase family serine peptidase [Amnibacterium flavum]PVZ94202.1 S9 family peptidase [Amnibacterium flavum]
MTSDASRSSADRQPAPFGSWVSPISATDVAAGVHAIEGGRFVGDEIWWSERRPTETGRTGVFRHGPDGEIVAVLAAPASARSRVHEYGGGAWTATPDGRLVYVEGSDQRVRVVPPAGAAVALTPEVESEDTSIAYGELSVRGHEVIAVREVTGPEAVSRHIVAIPLDGSAAHDPSLIRTIVGGSDFVAYPRFSPDGGRLAWIAWDHPQMPWDGTELRVADLSADRSVETWRTLAGGSHESILQPEWRDEDSLWAVADRSGFWRPVVVDLTGQVTEWAGDGRETGGPLWNLGVSWYLPLGPDRILARSSFGSDRLELFGPDGSTGVLELPFTSVDLDDVRTSSDGRTQILLTGGSAEIAGGLRLIDVDSASVELIRSDHDELPDPAYLPHAEERTFSANEKDGAVPSGPAREVHAVVYPPRNPSFAAPDGELPPYVLFVHGGPTAHAQASVNLTYAYYTSRGIGVVDVNYGGSTGYGREYRERLKGQWGVVDVEDVETVARGLAADGLADPARIAIEGGSAGGWTVLSALVRGDVFACGVSLYGVADLRSLAEGTHDFEARYTDGLVGPLPEAEELYVERSPLTHFHALDRPVLLLQGLDDKVVPPAQSERFRDAMIAAGVPHAYLEFEGESHGFRRAETRIRVREAALSFYGQTLGFTPPGVPVLELWRPTQP